jgi:DnaK suppressor protein
MPTIASVAHKTHRKALLKKRAEILSALRLDRGQTNERVAEEDQGTVAHEEFVTMRLNHLDYAQLRMIDEALDRIASGDYGICLSCDERIPDKRLTALPWARYCVPCQEHSSLGTMIEERPFRLAS